MNIIKNILQPIQFYQFGFKNSIEQIIPELEIEIKDDNFDFTYLITSQNTLLRLIITPSINNKFETIWIVKNYETLENTPDGTIYRVFCDLADPALALNSSCVYATKSEIKDLLKNDETYFEEANDIIRKILESSLSNGIRFNYSTFFDVHIGRPSSTPVQFISAQNITKLDAIKYLLSMGVNAQNLHAPTYLIYNIIRNEGFLANRYELLTNTKLHEMYFPDQTKITLTASSPNAGAPIVKSSQIKLPQAHLLRNGGLNFSKLFYNYVYREFDQIRPAPTLKVFKNKIEQILTQRNG